MYLNFDCIKYSNKIFWIEIEIEIYRSLLDFPLKRASNHRSPVGSPYKVPLMRKMFHIIIHYAHRTRWWRRSLCHTCSCPRRYSWCSHWPWLPGWWAGTSVPATVGCWRGSRGCWRCTYHCFWWPPDHLVSHGTTRGRAQGILQGKKVIQGTPFTNMV